MKKNIVIAICALFIVVGLVFIFHKATQPKALIAFVIDDWGYNQNNIELVLEIERPLTLAILPKLYYSSRIAKRVKEHNPGHDIILHLPLESKSNEAAERNTIRCNMQEEKIISILEGDIKSLPGIVGVSSHQGSKATQDERLMKVILTELKKRDLFFLDSMTTSNSACPEIAHDLGLRYTQRDVFLDITDQTDSEHFDAYIRGQIQELATIALKQKKAVGVGHNIKITLEVIKDVMPELEKQGIKIVPLKDLVK